MLNKRPGNSFLIVVLIVILGITSIRHPDIKAKFSSSYRQALFNQLQSELAANEFNPEHYWQFRERFSPGSFSRNQKNTGFFATFRITAIENELTPLFNYESNYLNSLDALIPVSSISTLKNINNALPSEIVSSGENFVLIKRTDTDYVLAFFEPIEEMQKVFGMFDYIPKENDLLKDKLWYNITFLKID